MVPDVLIVTALLDELDALLDVAYRRKANWTRESDPQGFPYHYCEFDGEDNNTYLITAAWAGGMGEIYAADTARQLIENLKPRSIAMCGICAGRRDSVALGDIVVADKIFNYEYGKRIVGQGEDGTRIEEQLHEITTYSPPASWQIDAEYITHDISWAKELPVPRPISLEQQRFWLTTTLLSGGDSNIVERPDRRERCPDWGTVVSLLEKEGLVSVKGGVLRLTRLGKSTTSEQMLRHPDGIADAPFKVIVGSMATGSRVQEDPELFDHLRRISRRVIAAEMEAAAIGFVGRKAGMPAIVIKGVSDYGDHNKDDRYREFASSASANLLVRFLLRNLKSADAELSTAELKQGRTPQNVLAEVEDSESGSESLNQHSLGIEMRPSIDSDIAFEAGHLVGREQELEDMKRWTIVERCRVLCLVGIGGIGKTSLAMALVPHLLPHFAQIFCRSVRALPPLSQILREALSFFATDSSVIQAETLDEQLAALRTILRQKECVLLLDNAESLLMAHEHGSHYRPEFEEYQRLFDLMAEYNHRSLLILTSREQPPHIVRQQASYPGIRVLELSGLDVLSGSELLHQLLTNINTNQATILNEHCAGNPLVLKLIVGAITKSFLGSINSFIDSGMPASGSVTELLDEQFKRLSEMEKAIMFRIALAQEPIPIRSLQAVLSNNHRTHQALELMASLRGRMLIQAGALPDTIGLQPVVQEYVTDVLVNMISSEIIGTAPNILCTLPLLETTSKEYIRQSQQRLVLRPIVDQIVDEIGSGDCSERLLRILKDERCLRTEYLAGNLINLCIAANIDLTGQLLEGYRIRNAFLRDVELHDVSLRRVSLSNCVFDEGIGPLLVCKFSRDGKLLASGGSSGEIRLYTAQDLRHVRTFVAHTDWLRSLDFDYAGKLLFSCGDDQAVRAWDLKLGTMAWESRGHNKRVRSVRASPSKSLLASGAEDGFVKLWRQSDGILLSSIPVGNWVRCLDFSPDGSILFIGTETGTIIAWNIERDQTEFKLEGHEARIRDICSDSTKARLYSASDDGTVKIWNLHTRTSVASIPCGSSRVWSIDCLSVEDLLVSGDEDGTVRVWSVHDGSLKRIIAGHSKRVWSVSLNPNAESMASTSEDCTMQLWDLRSGRCINSVVGYSRGVMAVDFDKDSHYLVAGLEDGWIELWDYNKQTLSQKLRASSGRIWSACFAPKGDAIASGGEDGTLRIWRFRNDAHAVDVGRHENWIRSVCFSPDGKLLASAGEDYTIRLWDPTTFMTRGVFNDHHHRVWSVAFSPDSTMLVSSGDDLNVRVWDVKTGRCIRAIPGDRVWSVAFTTDGASVLAGGEDCVARRWNLATGEETRYEGHDQWIRSLAIGQDGHTLVTSGDDRTVRIWDLGSGECKKILQGCTNVIRSVAINDSGTVVASGGDDQRICLWDVDSASTLGSLRSDRLYERMNINDVKGLSGAERSSLLGLGAIDFP